MGHRVRDASAPNFREVLGAAQFGTARVDLCRGLLMTLEAVRRLPKATLLEAYRVVTGLAPDRGVDTAVERVVLCAVQVAWYEDRQGRVPASCQKSLAQARQMAADTAAEAAAQHARKAAQARKNFGQETR